MLLKSSSEQTRLYLGLILHGAFSFYIDGQDVLPGLFYSQLPILKTYCVFPFSQVGSCSARFYTHSVV